MPVEDAVETRYALPDELDPAAVARALETGLDVVTEPPARRRVRYYDTFDWRLWRRGTTLRAYQTPLGPRVTWSRTDGTPRHHLEAREPPAFGNEFPEGPFRDEIAPLLAMRRLLPVAELDVASRELAAVDERGKKTARLWIEAGEVSAPGVAPRPLERVLRATPVRGFEETHARVLTILDETLGLERVAGDELSRALAALGRTPGDYTSKIRVELDPDMPAATAMKEILRAQLATMRRNEEGVRADLDSEFLHDFRVAVRRTRSALGQVPDVFPERVVTRMKRGFSRLGKLTGPTRDLDVYLLKIDEYRAELPPAVRRDLEPLETFLRREQRREQRRLARRLQSARYRRLMSSWQRFLDAPLDDGSGEAPANAARPIAEVASERIWRIWRKVQKRGSAIDEATPAEALHRLRIQCKKLRYLMEFFRSLYPGEEIGRLIKALKKLQDNLGDFNDYEVQQESLRGFAERMANDGAPAATLLAIGRLVAHLEAGQATERRRFGAAFARFARPENRALARALFKR